MHRHGNRTVAVGLTALLAACSGGTTTPGGFDAPPVTPDAFSCTDRCSVGERACASTVAYQECGNFDQDSCLEWSPTRNCQPGEKCLDGVCDVACTDECTTGAIRCTSDGTGTEACVADPTSGCMVWDDPVPCDAGESCSGGACSATCEDECADGSRQCAGTGYQVCGNHDGDECLDWGPVTPCGAGETCSDGECASSCVNECATGARECSGTGYRTCGDFDPDACLEWSAVVPCDAGMACSYGECTATCTDECTAGTFQCTGTGSGYQECQNTDADTCLEWGAVVTCPPATECDPSGSIATGVCVDVCGCDFIAGVCEPGTPDSTAACACDGDCAGGGSPCVADAYCDSWCPAGADPDCGCACDYNEYCEAASVGSSATCTCDPSCELHEVACSDDGHCDTWCPTGVDPDCGTGVDPCRVRWVDVGWRWADEMTLAGNYDLPDPVELGSWALLSPDLSAGEATMSVRLAAEHSACIDAIGVDVWGYDDSLFGDGAEVYLYNWDTWEYDMLTYTVGYGSTGSWWSNTVSIVSPYLLCGTDLCWIDVKIGASAWDNTHLSDVWVSAYYAP